MDESRILMRIKELETAREKFVTEANQQIAAFNGGIAELRALLEPPKDETNATPTP